MSAIESDRPSGDPSGTADAGAAGSDPGAAAPGDRPPGAPGRRTAARHAVPAEALTVDRRAFLRNAAFLGAGLAGIGTLGAVFHRPDAEEAEPPAAGTPRVFDTRAAEDASAPLLATVHGGDPGEAVRRAVEAMGGMARFVRSGEKVVVKPNIGWDRLPTHGANTNPAVVAAVVRMCLEAGAAKVTVTDVTCNEARRSFERSGIWRAAEDAGAEVVLPAEDLYDEIDLAGSLGRWRVLRPIAEADRIFNVPVVKHHGLAKVTAGMKNWYGALLDDGRNRLHQRIDEGIAELAQTFRPSLTIADATLVMVRHGPQGGSLGDVERRDLVAAATDPVALDAWAASLLGRETDELPYIGLAQQAGLGTARPNADRRVEIEL